MRKRNKRCSGSSNLLAGASACFDRREASELRRDRQQNALQARREACELRSPRLAAEQLHLDLQWIERGAIEQLELECDAAGTVLGDRAEEGFEAHRLLVERAPGPLARPRKQCGELGAHGLLVDALSRLRGGDCVGDRDVA